MNDIDFLYASDGTGEAIRPIVTGTRTVASTTLEIDSLNNWPEKFVATVGTLNEATGIIDGASVTIFKGHISGGDIIIDEFAPGYTDAGNSVGQVVVLKPNTFWADSWADIVKVAHNVDGTLKNNAVVTAAITDASVTYKKLAPVNYRANTTNSTQSNVIEQHGWGFYTTPGGVNNGDVTITLPVALDTFLGMQITPLGYKSGSDPSSISDFNNGSGFDGMALKTVSLTAPSVRVFNTQGSNWGSAERHGFMWTVIGTKA